MISRASRVFPGVLVSMLLAGPMLTATAQAGPPQDTTDATRKSNVAEHRRPAANARHQKSAAGPRRRTGPAPVTTAFVDDGFSYTESPTGEAGWKQTGAASWYGGKRWQGNRTSSGTRYDENALTAAHATLPLGSKVRVALHNSDRSITVTITDRPGTRSRIIDLSRGAAAALGILGQGVAMVTLSPGS
jgi:rare lipoprotein A (peptidoglycan hydrolase)